jgi:iron complex transport system substrate-binding protein
MRIVSLYPAATEVVALLGLADQLVGISHECDFPPSLKSLPQVTRCTIPAHATSAEIDAAVRAKISAGEHLYEIDANLLQQLQPDLILTQSLCKVCAVDRSSIEMSLGPLAYSAHILALQPVSFDNVLDDIQLVATACDSQERGQEIREALRARIQHVEQTVKRTSYRPSVVMLEWLDPLFSSGHWTPELIRLAGARELIGRERELSRTITREEVIAANPDILIIACCGYNKDRSLLDIEQTDLLNQLSAINAVKHGQVYLGDGNAYFNRPGPRLVDTLEMLAASFHPDLINIPESHPQLSRLSEL